MPASIQESLLHGPRPIRLPMTRSLTRWAPSAARPTFKISDLGPLTIGPMTTRTSDPGVPRVSGAGRTHLWLAWMAFLVAGCAAGAPPSHASAASGHPTPATTHPSRRCQASGVSVTVVGTLPFSPPVARRDTAVTSFQVTNTGSGPCRIAGFVVPVTLLGAGQALHPRLRLGPPLITGDDHPGAFTLPPGHSIAFSVQYLTTGPAGCSRPAEITNIHFSDHFAWAARHGHGLAICPGVIKVGPPHAPVY